MRKILFLLAVLAFAAPPAFGYINSNGNGDTVGQSPLQPAGFHGAAVVQRANANETYAGAATGTLTVTSEPAAADTVTVGTGTYTFKSSLTGAANEVLIGTTIAHTVYNLQCAVNNSQATATWQMAGSIYGLGTVANASAFASPGALVASTGTVTDGNTTNVSAGDTITIGGTAYRFESSLAQVGDVQIGGSADATLLSLAKTLNGTGTAGTDMFAGTPANAFVSASSSVTSHAITLTALTAGADGNAITTTTTSSHLTLSGAALSGGTTAELFTAAAAGTSGNSVATTYSSSALSFGATTLAGGTASPSATQDAVLVNELRDALVQKGLIKGSPP